MSVNFDYLKENKESAKYFKLAENIEKLFSSSEYTAESIGARKIAENIAIFLIKSNNLPASSDFTFSQNLSVIKSSYFLDRNILDLFYQIKQSGNQAAHNLDEFSHEEGLFVLKNIFGLLLWFSIQYCGYVGSRPLFKEPANERMFSTFSGRRVIYVQTGDNSSGKWPAYLGREKIGEASIDGYEADLNKNSSDLRRVSENRIRSYMGTSAVPFKLQWAELAYLAKTNSWFTDHDVHRVLDRSGVKRDPELVENGGREWFITNVDTAKNAILAVKNGQEAINSPVQKIQIELRPEQKQAVTQTERVFKNDQKMLWNAKMRFGKTLSALQLIKDEKYQKVLIMTHRPVVSDSWFDDFNKIGMSDSSFTYGSKNKGLSLEKLVTNKQPFIYFASMQDLAGSTTFGGKISDKNQLVRDIDWSLVIIDEAHEGTQTALAQQVIQGVTKPSTRILELSGTPFNLMEQYSNNPDQVYTWDYVMEQKAKQDWLINHPNKSNPYAQLPKVLMYTYKIKNQFPNNKFLDIDHSSFNFREFFKVNDMGRFIYEVDVIKFLNNITSPSKNSNYPFSTPEFRNELRHTLWLMPSVASAKAMKTLMEQHPIFGFDYKIINIVDNNDDLEASEGDLERVRKGITNHPAQTKTITLTVRKLTTGVNIPQWTGVFFLSNTNSAMQYLQAAFRAQTPYSDEELGSKKNCYIFDFAPDRALTVMAASTSLNTGAGKLQTDDQKMKMGELLNFLPILGETSQGMKRYQINSLLTQLKHVYAEKAVSSGFDDDSLYNDELLKLDEADLSEFNNLKAIVGSTKAEKKKITIDINNQGLTDEEYNQSNEAKKKPKKELTPEERDLLERTNQLKKQRKTMISILRSISIRIPMMIYGMDIDLDQDVDINTFVNKVDQESWTEFMPKGVTKDQFRIFEKYYDPQIFIEAGRLIRQQVKRLDTLEPLERTSEIGEIFSTFKNPDKETVLTPWRVVNLQLGKTIGGYSYFDTDFRNTVVDGHSVNHWIQTDETDIALKADTRILEINSKTGLYPLYAASSLYYQAQKSLNEQSAGKFTAQEDRLWQNILKNNIFVVAKTPMAKTITQRTLSGYRNYGTNIAYIDGIVKTAKSSINAGTKRILEAFNRMKFDVVVGNPPYQEEAGGESSSDKPIYHLFMEMAYLLAAKTILITPARFLFGAGGTPSSWNQKMLHDPHLEVVLFEQKSGKIFPHTDIKGGVAITFRDENQNFGSIGTFTPFPELRSILGKVSPSLNNGNLSDIIYSQNKLNLDQVYKDYPESANLISSQGRDRRLESNIFTKLPIFKERSQNQSFVKVLGLINNKRLYRFVDRKYIDVTHQNFDKYKVLLPKSNGSGALGEVISTPLIGTPLIGTPLIGYTRSFIGIGAFESKNEADAALKYVKTKFMRTMLGILKVTQDNNPDKWSKVPLQNFNYQSDIDWSKTIPEIDQQLYKKFNLNEDEIKFIETHVQEMK
ncbi:Eco57I restriction-modification methylase domain-containing protein [Oenococcus sicerae]|uniref:Restriction endonuclease n=1 Tax=Oenococcus sicerae TaxID=2203724 RepID=A0AAJ1RDB9_9LACO|nr:Eco57I restriction-modification methylase domain-containing protein [Oenococcus sicerae]MDN6899861.1 restriction endonuclease [Oenococcus sicerae]